MDFRQLKKHLKKDNKDFSSTKIAFLSDSTSQLYTQALKAWGIVYERNFEIWESDYDQVTQQLLDPSSDYHEQKPEFSVVLNSTHKLWSRYQKTSPGERHNFWATETSTIRDRLTSTLSKVIYSNFEEFDDSVFGNFANKVDQSFIFQVRMINIELMKMAQDQSNFFVLDLQSLQSRSSAPIRDNNLLISSDIPHSLDHIAIVTSNIADIICAILGNIRKCLILDLDNTLWGGIIGDDGVENIQIGSLGIGKAFTRLQQWAKLLKERGILLAICSKNEEKTAKDPFLNHPEMVLRLEDLAIFIANWEPKSENIKRIQNILNIGFDSMVFIDDNPAEREEVKTALPDITVPDLPVDPVDYLDYLLSLNLFETASASSEDTARTEKYQAEAKRISTETSFKDQNEFLKSLQMCGKVEGVTPFNTPRIAQLSQRSNQYNFRTIRYSEEEIAHYGKSPEKNILAFNLKDKFGDYGLICVVVLNVKTTELFIENWMMSCRVLKRGVEGLVLNVIAEFAKQKGLDYIVGEYLPSPKNVIVKDFFKDNGFTQLNNLWNLEIKTYEKRQHQIKLEN